VQSNEDGGLVLFSVTTAATDGKLRRGPAMKYWISSDLAASDAQCAVEQVQATSGWPYGA